jgi:hypothetical protein
MNRRAARTVATRAVHLWAEDEPARLAWLADCLGRHLAGDWGDLDAHDRAVNDAAVRQNRGRLLSAYLVPASLHRTTIEIQLWVITDDLDDPDTATTVLWPSDY